jgi:hypothetical protein
MPVKGRLGILPLLRMPLRSSCSGHILHCLSGSTIEGVIVETPKRNTIPYLETKKNPSFQASRQILIGYCFSSIIELRVEEQSSWSTCYSYDDQWNGERAQRQRQPGQNICYLSLPFSESFSEFM